MIYKSTFKFEPTMEDNKKQKVFIVTCTKIYNAEMEVVADSKDEAVNWAQNHINILDEQNRWFFGEATADYADEQRHYD
jgi:hypothetical protein